MKRTTLFLALLLPATLVFAQDYEIKTLFKTGQRASGGYGALTNKFTTIDGQFANMTEAYGGWFVNHKFLLGIGAASATNNLPVPLEFSTAPDRDMSYQYCQFGLMLEYTLWSHRAIHFAIQSFTGPGFTLQYSRQWNDDDYWEEFEHMNHDSNWFFVTEPGVKLEMNLFKWMRFSPGVSYRTTYGSGARGLPDKALSGTSVNLTLKFGKF